MTDEEREAILSILQSAAHIQRMALHAAFQNGFSDDAVRDIRLSCSSIERDVLKALRKHNGR